MACKLFILDKMKRVYPSPYPVKMIAYDRQYDNKLTYYHSYNKNAWEIALRLLSDDSESADILGGQHISMTFPHVFIKPPKVLYKNNSCGIREFISFQYSLETAQNIIQAGLLTRKPAWPITLDRRMCNYVAEIKELLEHTSEFGIVNRLDTLCYSIIQELALQRDAGSQKPTNSLIASAESYIRFHFEENIAVPILAEKFGLSTRSFYRLWMQIHDISPLEWLKQRRLENATEELITSHRSIKEIAARSGFQDSSYFAKTFQKYYGVPPMEYRNQASAKVFCKTR